MNPTPYATARDTSVDRTAMAGRFFFNTTALPHLALETSSARNKSGERRRGVAIPEAFHRLTMNHLLAALPIADLERLSPDLELVKMPQCHALYESGECPRHVYFPTTSVAALHCDFSDGALAEVALVGNDGMLGISLFMGGEATPNRTSVQIEGFGYRMTGLALKQEFDRGGYLQQLLLRYTQSLITQIALTAACNRHHKVEQQLCRVLLSCFDRMPHASMPLTHELLANLLGVRRESVSESASRLQRAGLIHYVRRDINIVDRGGLEKVACECYSVIKADLNRLKSIVHRNNSVINGHTCSGG